MGYDKDELVMIMSVVTKWQFMMEMNFGKRWAFSAVTVLVIIIGVVRSKPVFYMGAKWMCCFYIGIVYYRFYTLIRDICLYL